MQGCYKPSTSLKLSVKCNKLKHNKMEYAFTPCNTCDFCILLLLIKLEKKSKDF